MKSKHGPVRHYRRDGDTEVEIEKEKLPFGVRKDTLRCKQCRKWKLDASFHVNRCFARRRDRSDICYDCDPHNYFCTRCGAELLLANKTGLCNTHLKMRRVVGYRLDLPLLGSKEEKDG